MVVDIQPNGQIYQIGRVTGALHIYNTNHPAAPSTDYHITITQVLYQNNQIQPGHTDTFHPNGNAVYVQNDGPSKLQVLYMSDAVSVSEAGWTTVDEHPPVNA